MQSVTRAWPPVPGVLQVRWLEIAVTALPQGGTQLYAESQSEWVVTRPTGERIPSDVRQVSVTDGWPGKPPFLSRHVTAAATVHRIVRLFNSLGVAQPAVINCPAEVVSPTVDILFRSGSTGAPIARATVSSTAVFHFSPLLGGADCFPIAMTIAGHRRSSLVGNVISPIQRLLHLRLVRRRGPVRS
jgi:hypothetical protein